MFNKQRLAFIFLGIGIGIILTNILYTLYPNIEYKDYSEEQIIDKATNLGMVFIKDNIDTFDDKQAKKEKEEDKSVEVSTVQSQKKEEEIKFVVEEGDSLEKVTNGLLELGIINDAKEFDKYVKDRNAEGKLRVGTYKLSPNLDYETIIKILTKSIK